VTTGISSSRNVRRASLATWITCSLSSAAMPRRLVGATACGNEGAERPEPLDGPERSARHDVHPTAIEEHDDGADLEDVVERTPRAPLPRDDGAVRVEDHGHALL